MRKLRRAIGIDFGTSSTVVMCRNEDQSEPAGATIDRQNAPHHVIPTVVFTDHTGHRDFGMDALRKARRQPENLKRNFKMDLVSPDPSVRAAAKQTLQLFFDYLYRGYDGERDIPVGVELIEDTFVSYPVKWPEELRETVKAAATRAGFPNVKGIDEPSAAMRYVLGFDSQSMRLLKAAGVVRDGAPLTAMLIDMGAGTTDLVLYRYTPGSLEGHAILATWPPVDEVDTFGGREIDARLASYLKAYFSGNATVDRGYIVDRNADEVKRWKETDVSPALSAGGACPQGLPPFFAAYEEFLDAKKSEFPALDSVTMGRLLAGYLPTLPRLINGLLAEGVRLEGIRSPEDIDLVVLTGGHSQWYFVREILQGRWVPGLETSPEADSGVRLPKIQADENRILSTSLPQETVARGLTLMTQPVRIGKVSANNLWLRLTFDGADLSSQLVVKMGERLPATHVHYWHFQYKGYFYHFSAVVGCRTFAGRTLETAREFEPFTVKVSPTAGERLAAAVLGVVLVPFAAIPYFAPEKAPLVDGYAVVQVTVAEDEKLSFAGLLNCAEGAAAFHFGRPPLTPDENARLTGLMAAWRAERDAAKKAQSAAAGRS